MLPKFASLGVVSLERFGCSTTAKQNEAEVETELCGIFNVNDAKYHSNCVSEYNEQKLMRAIKRKEKTDQSGSGASNKRARRSDSDSRHSLGDMRCLFCQQTDLSKNLTAAGTKFATIDKVNREHVDRVTNSIREKALKLNDTQVLASLSTGDVIANEIFYHTKCFKAFDYRHQVSVDNETKLPLDARRDFLELFYFEKKS